MLICTTMAPFFFYLIQSALNNYQVGDGDTDHYCWQRPEDMTTSRRAYKVDERNPGSDVAGETAAAMAAASIVFRKLNPHYSHLLLHHAQQVSQLMRLLTCNSSDLIVTISIYIYMVGTILTKTREFS